jgi:hypothetical protein
MKKENEVFIYKPEEDFPRKDSALTIDPSEVCDDNSDSGYHKKTHKDGWTIEGKIHEDYYTWVNEFKAEHPTLGKVWGDFEEAVFSEQEEGFKDFYAKHPPSSWDYGDI